MDPVQVCGEVDPRSCGDGRYEERQAEAGGEMSGKRRDLTGERFGRLTVLAFAGNACEGKRQAPVGMWMCRCECGTEKPIKGANLYRGLIQSCGCFRRERFAQLGAQTSVLALTEDSQIVETVRVCAD